MNADIILNLLNFHTKMAQLYKLSVAMDWAVSSVFMCRASRAKGVPGDRLILFINNFFEKGKGAESMALNRPLSS